METEQQKPEEKGGLRRKTVSGMTWTAGANGIRAVAQIVITVVLARLLTPDEFGLVAAALVAKGLVETFSLVGVQPAIIQHPGIEKHHLQTGTTLSVGISFLLGAAFWLAAPLTASFFQMPRLIELLRVLSLAFPISGLTIVCEAVMRKELRFRELARLDVVSHVFGYGGVGVTLAFLGWGAWALIIATLAQGASRWVLIWIRETPVLPSWNGSAARDLAVYSGGVSLTQVFTYFSNQGDNIIIGRWLGPAALGLYGRAYNLMVASLKTFASAMDGALFPALAQVQDRPEKLKTAFKQSLTLTAMVAIPMGVLISILSPEIVAVMLGPGWEGAIMPLQILAFGTLFRVSYRISDAVARAKAAVYQQAFRRGLYAAVLVSAAFLGKGWGIEGVAAGVLVALAFNHVVMAHLGMRLTGMTWPDFIMSHAPGTIAALMIAVSVLPAVILLREVVGTAIVVLVAGGAIGGVMSLLFIVAGTRGVIGRRTMALFREVFAMIPERSVLYRFSSRFGYAHPEPPISTASHSS